MKPARGYYALVQYCPNPSRDEGANVAVILFSPELRFIDIRSSTTSDRIRRFFAGTNLDAQRIDSAKRAMVSRIRRYKDDFKSLDDFAVFVASRGNDLRLVAPRPIVVSEPERQLDELFAELVGDRSHPVRSPRTIRELDEAFKKPSLSRKILFNQRLEVPVIRREIMVPYAYENGRTNLVIPQRFSGNEQTAIDSAMRLAVEGELFDRHARKTVIVVGSFVTGLEQVLNPRFEQLFGDFKTRYVSPMRIHEFVSEVESQAH